MEAKINIRATFFNMRIGRDSGECITLKYMYKHIHFVEFYNEFNESKILCPENKSCSLSG